MKNWRLINRTWCLWPSRPNALIEIIGGSYLSGTPQISYKRLLEGLFQKDLAIHAWTYLPGFDHQTQANQAWKEFRSCKNKLENRIGNKVQSIRLGHSLGCKLHLLAPDGGRNARSLIAVSFNNFTAKKSIPMFSELSPKSGKYSEFKPDPLETLRLIRECYMQPSNLLIRFKEDHLDETSTLLGCLKQRSGEDKSCELEMYGDHLTPASFGLRKNLLGQWANDKAKREQIKSLTETISNWCSYVS